MDDATGQHHDTETWAEAASALTADGTLVASRDLHTDVLASHGGTGRNLYVRWSPIPDDAAEIDVVVYLHGFSGRQQADETMLLGKVRNAALDQALPTGRSRPLVAIVPRGKNDGWSDSAESWRYTFPGLLHNQGEGLEQLVHGVLQWLAVRMGRASSGSIRPRRMTLVAHSGGGAPLERLLGSSRPLCNPHEVIVFDALYGPAPNLERWTRSRVAADDLAIAMSLPPGERDRRMREVGGALRILYRGGTRTASENVARAVPARSTPTAGFYRVQRTPVGHNDIPAAYLPMLLTDMAQDVPNVAAGRWGGQGNRDELLAFRTGDESTRARHANAVRAWIQDASASGLDLLPGDLRSRLLGIDWSRQAFPGSEAEESARTGFTMMSDGSRALFDAFVAYIPERRVPRTVTWHDVDSEVVPVPDAGRHRLWPEARDAFVLMRDAARADGVTLTISSSYRTAAQQRAIAANNRNPNAVAQTLSAHTFGLAVDLGTHHAEMTPSSKSTSPMTNMILRYRTAPWKWLALNAHRFGFFPYRNEPWHWEYNPSGLADRYASRAPARIQSTEEPNWGTGPLRERIARVWSTVGGLSAQEANQLIATAHEGQLQTAQTCREGAARVTTTVPRVDLGVGTSRAHMLGWGAAPHSSLRPLTPPGLTRSGTLGEIARAHRDAVVQRVFGPGVSALDAGVAARLAETLRRIDVATRVRAWLFRETQYGVVATLNPEGSSRYAPEPGKTFCNIYLYDHVVAMGGWLPRVWWNSVALRRLEAGATLISADDYRARVRRHEDVSRVVAPVYETLTGEMNANALTAWMAEWGVRYGWVRAASMTEAQTAANNGELVVILAANRQASHSGHVNVIVAEDAARSRVAAREGENVTRPLQSQAGASNFNFSNGRGAWWSDRNHERGAAWIYRGPRQPRCAIEEEFGN